MNINRKYWWPNLDGSSTRICGSIVFGFRDYLNPWRLRHTIWTVITHQLPLHPPNIACHWRSGRNKQSYGVDQVVWALCLRSQVQDNVLISQSWHLLPSHRQSRSSKGDTGIWKHRSVELPTWQITFHKKHWNNFAFTRCFLIELGLRPNRAVWGEECGAKSIWIFPSFSLEVQAKLSAKSFLVSKVISCAVHQSCTGLEHRNLLLQSLLHGTLVNAISRQLVRVRPTKQIMVNLLGWVVFRGDRALQAAGGPPWIPQRSACDSSCLGTLWDLVCDSMLDSWLKAEGPSPADRSSGLRLTLTSTLTTFVSLTLYLLPSSSVNCHTIWWATQTSRNRGVHSRC
jgi:hypothetical protein